MDPLANILLGLRYAERYASFDKAMRDIAYYDRLTRFIPGAFAAVKIKPPS